MGSLSEARIEGFICRLCSQIDRNVIHIYTDEGLQKKLEQKINVYLKINLSRYDPLPKVICLPCDAKLEQHHRFIQRVIQNQKKIHDERQGDRPIIPLLEQHLRVRVSPVIRNGSGTSTYNIEAISSSDSDSTDSEEQVASPQVEAPEQPNPTSNINDNAAEVIEEISEISSSSSSSGTSSPSNASMNNDEPLAGFSPNLEPVDALWSNTNSNSSSSSSSSSSSDSEDVIQTDEI